MLDLREFNSSLVAAIRAAAHKDAAEACSMFNIDAYTLGQIASLKYPESLSGCLGCIARANITMQQLVHRTDRTVNAEIAELNFQFLNLIRLLAQSSIHLAIGLTSVNLECCEKIKKMSLADLKAISTSNKPVFRFAVKQQFLSRINSTKNDFSAQFLCKHAAAITWQGA